MVDSAAVAAKLRLYFGTPGGDVVHAVQLYTDDAVLEFPQSGERYEGRETFTKWRSAYPTDVAFEVLRVTIRDDLAVVEISAGYGGGASMFGVSLLEFDGELICRERIYLGEGWEPPPWRAHLLADRPAESPGW